MKITWTATTGASALLLLIVLAVPRGRFTRPRQGAQRGAPTAAAYSYVNRSPAALALLALFTVALTLTAPTA